MQYIKHLFEWRHNSKSYKTQIDYRGAMKKSDRVEPIQQY